MLSNIRRILSSPYSKAVVWCILVLVLGNLPDIIAWLTLKTHTFNSIIKVDSVDIEHNGKQNYIDFSKYIFSPDIICTFSLCLLSAALVDIVFFGKNILHPISICGLFICYVFCLVPILLSKCNVEAREGLMPISYGLFALAVIIAGVTKGCLFNYEHKFTVTPQNTNTRPPAPSQTSAQTIPQNQKNQIS